MLYSQIYIRPVEMEKILGVLGVYKKMLANLVS